MNHSGLRKMAFFFCFCAWGITGIGQKCDFSLWECRPDSEQCIHMYILSVIPIKALIQMKDMYGLRLDEHHGLGRVEYFETVDDQSNPLSTIGINSVDRVSSIQNERRSRPV